MFFIVSTGRTGSVTIAHILSLIHGCICLHEPAPELILESSGYRYGKITKSELSKILKETRSPLLNGSIYCESNQTLSLIIPVLVDVFPQARYIWLMRNGLDVVASFFSKQMYTGHSENHDRYEDCPPIERAWIDGRIQGDLCGDVSPEDWNNMPRFEKCCWYWGYVNRIIEEDLNKHAPNSYKLLHLENLDFELSDIISWMGMKTAIVPRAKRHNVARREPYHWSMWCDEEKEMFNRWCGSMMDRLYPDWRTSENDWKGVEYNHLPARRVIDNYIFIKIVNSILARNSTS